MAPRGGSDRRVKGFHGVRGLDLRRDTARSENALPPAQTDKPNFAPFLAADAVADKEQAVRIIALLDGEQPRIIRAPIGPLPVSLKITALRDVSATLWRDLPQFSCSLLDPSGVA